MSSLLGWIVKILVWAGVTWLVFIGLYVVAARYGFMHLMPVSDMEIIVVLLGIGAAIPVVLWTVRAILQLAWALVSGIAEGVRDRGR